MSDSNDLVFWCEVCGRVVESGERSARVSAETCISDGRGGGVKLADDQEVVLAVFHAECVSGTYAARECDVVPYLSEARELIDGTI